MAYQNKKERCTFSCDSKKDNYQKFYCKPGSLRIETEFEMMQQQIYEDGPVMVGLMVYEDLYNYKEGIYEYTTGGLIGGHAVRLIGWGHDSDGHLYWVAQNQWTADWGEKGYFRVKAGEIGIDTWTLGCMPDILIEE